MRKLLLIIFYSSTVLAQDNFLSLSLDEAVEYGIENNRNLRNAEREIQMAFKERWKTIAIGLPNVSLELNYLNNLELQTSLIPAEFFGGNKGDFSEIQFGTEQSAIGSVRMEQLLFDGSWLLENNLDNFKKDLFEVTELYENGFEEIENVEQIKITLAQAELSLLQTKKTQENQLNLLKLILGINLEDNLILTTSINDFIADNIIFSSSINSFSEDQNIDVKISQNLFDTKRIEYRLEKSKQLPKLSGFISGTYTGYNNEFDFTSKAQNWFGSSVFGVKFELPLTNANKLNISSQKAKIAMDQAATNLEEQKEKTRAEVQQKLTKKI